MSGPLVIVEQTLDENKSKALTIIRSVGVPKTVLDTCKLVIRGNFQSGRRYEHDWYDSSPAFDFFKNAILAQKWKAHLNSHCRVYLAELVQFYATVNVDLALGKLTATINNKPLVLTIQSVGDLLDVPIDGLSLFPKNGWPTIDGISSLTVTKFLQPKATSTTTISASDLKIQHKFFFNLIYRTLLPCIDSRGHCSILDMWLLYHLANHLPINLPALMFFHIDHLAKLIKVGKVESTTVLAYGMWISSMFEVLDLVDSTSFGVDNLCDVMDSEKSKILVIGGTGYIGKFIVEASVKAGHSTFALVRNETLSSPAKAAIIDNFKSLGVHLVTGDVYDHESLVKAIKQVDVVISTVGYFVLADQVKIIDAIKEAGNVKRFFPSEFGVDVDRTSAVEPAKSAFVVKASIRRAVEAAGIPYTYVSANNFAGLAVDDPRTLNKTLYIKPSGNTISFNELVSLWEKKIGVTLEKVYVPEDQLLKNIQDSPPPTNVFLAIGHAVFVKGDQTNFEIEPSFGVEASELYPDVKYTSVDEYLNQFV
ncbi:hypothetical protein KSS87_020776 [Heliosperma pusillum]|nr:hypothetical protein KSS87_020776 [Heliosperma pusillum]